MDRKMVRVLWAGIFVGALLTAGTTMVLGVDRLFARWLSPVGMFMPVFNLIWVVGGLPLTTALILGRMLVQRKGFRKKRWDAFILFLAGSVIEAVCKHFVALPMPHAVPEPTFYRTLEIWTNIEPSTLSALVNRGAHTGSIVGFHPFFYGSFPSGHVFRVTYTVGFLLDGRRNWLLWSMAALATFSVVATGGHWIWDTLGGFALARWALTYVSPPNADHSVD